MYTYRAYGLCIHSAFELAGLPRGDGVADIIIHDSPISERLGQGDYDFNRNVAGRIFDELLFLVENGEEMFIELKKDISKDLLRSYLLGVLMATLLRQRGLLVLHACAVERDGIAICFAGESGWGKSTIAEYFCQRGYRLMTDDVLAVRTDADKPVAVPSYPQVRLREESARLLRENDPQLEVIEAQTTKWVHASHEFQPSPMPLSRIYMLKPAYEDRTEIAPLSARSALMMLVRHTRAMNLIKDPAFLDDHMKQCNRLVQSIPVVQLNRERRLDRLDVIYDAVTRDVRSAAAEGLASQR